MRLESPVVCQLIVAVFTRFILRTALVLVLLLGCAVHGRCASKAKEGAKDVGLPWSFRPLQSSTPPSVRDNAWTQTRIDQFLLAKMEAAKLKPAEPATARVLIRRLWFDVVGLPPSPEDVARWEKELTTNGKLNRAAYGRLVDSLLASPHYGERWGRFWLDLARYTDTNPGYLESAASAWLYRDWVVRALNIDLPYTEFVKQQLAVDLMPGHTPEERHALGFLGLSPTYFKELKLPPELIKGTVADEWEEHVDAIGRTFLGLTLACARCHDHKSDPVTAADYYALAGVFASVRIKEIPAMGEELWAPVAKARAEVAALEKERDALKKKKPADLAAKVAEFDKRIADIKQRTPHYNVPMANGVEEAALYVVSAGTNGTTLDYRKGKARDLEMQRRGNPNQTGEIIPRRFLSAFPTKTGAPRQFIKGSGRLELAEAILEDAAPLSARVIVNRVWRQHFGRGLVNTPSEFGALGDAPTHPELLDDLTSRFVANGWSLKWLHREIFRSAAWQQSSLSSKSERVDPENRLYARMLRRRLDVEAWRDSMLSASGVLELKLGGPSELLNSEKNHRRTLYGTVNRDELDPMLRINDFPEATSHSPTRSETATPLQLLFALNSPFLQQQADALAGRLERDSSKSLRDRVERAYALLYQRKPTTKELSLATRFLKDRETDRAVWSEYAQTLLGSNELLFID